MPITKENFTRKFEEMIIELRRELGIKDLKGIIEFNSSFTKGFSFDYKIKDKDDKKIIDCSHSG